MSLFFTGLFLLLAVYPSLAQPSALVREHHLAETVAAPSLVTVSSTPQSVFATNNAIAAGRVLLRTIQNCGTNAVLYAIGTTVATTNYHGVLAGGAAVRDGLGTVLDVSRIKVPVSLMTESGTSVCALVELTQ